MCWYRSTGYGLYSSGFSQTGRSKVTSKLVGNKQNGLHVWPGLELYRLYLDYTLAQTDTGRQRHLRIEEFQLHTSVACFNRFFSARATIC